MLRVKYELALHAMQCMYVYVCVREMDGNFVCTCRVQGGVQLVGAGEICHLVGGSIKTPIMVLNNTLGLCWDGTKPTTAELTLMELCHSKFIQTFTSGEGIKHYKLASFS